ncbi:MAG TPA: hypothetical protein VHQ65_13575 [Thermoanaerobaculia bacterium]|nr:hypothetical protein [Thermoanaerobaculia bacterium]
MKKMFGIAFAVVLVALAALPALAVPPYCECEVCPPSRYCTIPGTWIVIRCTTYQADYCSPLRAVPQAEASALDRFLDELAAPTAAPAEQAEEPAGSVLAPAA